MFAYYRQSRFGLITPILLLMVAAAAPAAAQDEPRQNNAGFNAILDNIDLLVDNYAGFLARKYDLTEEQDEYTKYLLRERANEFIGSREDELRDLLGRMFEVRAGGDMDPQELIEWGERVRPLYDEAKEMIIKGNDEWREILNDEQKKIHDEDVALMYESFDTTEANIEQIVSGEMSVDEFRNPRRHKQRTTTRNRATAAREPDQSRADRGVPVSERRASPDRPQVEPLDRKIDRPDSEEEQAEVRRKTSTIRPRREPGERVDGPTADVDHQAGDSDRGRTPDRSRTRRTADKPEPNAAAKAPKKGWEGDWERYVEQFIEKYSLDDEQKQKAESILEDCKKQAHKYMQARQPEIDKLDQLMEEARKSKDKNKSQNLAELKAKSDKLKAPVDRIFEQQLKPRLDRLPTGAQRKAAEAASKTKKGSKHKSASEEQKKDDSDD